MSQFSGAVLSPLLEQRLPDPGDLPPRSLPPTPELLLSAEPTQRLGKEANCRAPLAADHCSSSLGGGSPRAISRGVEVGYRSVTRHIAHDAGPRVIGHLREVLRTFRHASYAHRSTVGARHRDGDMTFLGVSSGIVHGMAAVDSRSDSRSWIEPIAQLHCLIHSRGRTQLFFAPHLFQGWRHSVPIQVFQCSWSSSLK